MVPVGGDISRSVGKLWSVRINWKKQVTEGILLEAVSDLHTFSLFLFPVHHEMSNLCYTLLSPFILLFVQKHRAKTPWVEPSGTVRKINKLLLSGVLVTVARKVMDTNSM